MESMALYGSTTTSDTLGDGNTEYVPNDGQSELRKTGMITGNSLMMRSGLEDALGQIDRRLQQAVLLHHRHGVVHFLQIDRGAETRQACAIAGTICGTRLFRG